MSYRYMEQTVGRGNQSIGNSAKGGVATGVSEEYFVCSFIENT